MPPLTGYRPDIDGLRALAIVAVVIFHAFPSALPGGFVGVDVFFVISGYLISGIIIDALDRGRFSFAEFYYRRIRRIVPALILVLAVTFVLGWALLLPAQLRHLGSQTVAGALFLANFKYWREAGYFDGAADTKPLLHLWSLGVEEQFYVVWPLLLWAAWRWGGRRGLAILIAGLGLASFAVNIVHVEMGHTTAAFYSPLARFWELMLGAAVRLALSRGPDSVRVPALRDAASVAGLGMIALACALVPKAGSFPGWWALLPTVGTALAIGAGPAALLNRAVLSRPVAVGIGLISYPLYLWHWPLLSLARIAEGELPAAVRLGIVVLSVALAFATYRLVERPVRVRLPPAFRPSAALAAGLLALVPIGVAAWTERLQSPSAVQVTNAGEIVDGGEDGNAIYYTYQTERFVLCTPAHLQAQAERHYWPARCLQSKPGETRDVAIIGDSHAEDLFIGLAEALPQLNVVKYIQGTLPVRSAPVFQDIYDTVARDRNIHTVVIASYWHARRVTVPAGTTMEAELTSTINTLVSAGKTVFLAEVRPVFPFPAEGCRYEGGAVLWQSRHLYRCDMPLADYEAQSAPYRAMLSAISRKLPNVHLLRTTDPLCDDTSCRMALDGLLLYRGEDHLTISGSRVLGAAVAAQITEADALRARAGAGAPAAPGERRVD